MTAFGNPPPYLGPGRCTHGPAKLSNADRFAFSIRATENICAGYFTAVILARSEGSDGFDISECYLVDRNRNCGLSQWCSGLAAEP